MGLLPTYQLFLPISQDQTGKLIEYDRNKILKKN